MQKPKVWSSACRKLHEWGMRDTRDSLLGQYKDLPRKVASELEPAKGFAGRQDRVGRLFQAEQIQVRVIPQGEQHP